MRHSRQLLYVSPVVPDVTGNGLAMRAGTIVRLLATRFDVTLLVVPRLGFPHAQVAAAVSDCCRDVVVRPFDEAPGGPSPLLAALRLPWPTTRAGVPSALRIPTLATREFDVVHVYRLSALPDAFPYLFRSDGRLRWQIDIDEAEAASRRALAVLHRVSGRPTMARFLELEAGLTEQLECDISRRAHRMYVSSEAERLALTTDPAYPQPRVLPNTLPPPSHAPATATRNPFTFLFVGTLAFEPNSDAVRFFCLSVLPRLRELAPRPFLVAIVGGGAPETMRDIRSLAEVRFTGAVADVGGWYASSSAVIVPLRAGGGVRLKVLEAMRARRPIVTTTAGISGVDAQHETHALMADSAEAFATQCVRLMRDAVLADRLARNAFDLFMRDHTTASAAEVLHA